jgi:two-component system nitrogen regulation response regulator GlnG
VFPIELPPLRQRTDDIPLLAEHFLRGAQPDGVASLRFSEAAIKELTRRHWSGNVRELRNAVEAAALLARSGEILPEHLPTNIAPVASEPGGRSLAAEVRAWAAERLGEAALPHELHAEFLRAVEPALFAAVLERTGHNRAAAANVLGLHRATLRKKLSGD